MIGNDEKARTGNSFCCGVCGLRGILMQGIHSPVIAKNRGERKTS